MQIIFGGLGVGMETAFHLLQTCSSFCHDLAVKTVLRRLGIVQWRGTSLNSLLARKDRLAAASVT